MIEKSLASTEQMIKNMEMERRESLEEGEAIFVEMGLKKRRCRRRIEPMEVRCEMGAP